MLFEHIFKRYGYLVLFCFCSLCSYSQNYIDLLKINAGTTPLNTFDSSSTTSVLNEYGVDATVPIKLNEKSTFLTGFIYENIQTKLFTEQRVQTLTSVVLKLGISHQFNERFTSTFMLLPKIASNFGQINNKDFQIGGIAIFKYKLRDNLNFKYGLYYNSERFGPFFVPMLGLYYMSKNNKFEMNVMLPLQADFNYKIIKLLNVGVNFNGQVRSYHVSNISPGLSSAYVSRATNEVFGYLKFNFGKNFVCQTKVGQSFGRRYRVYNDNDKMDFAMPPLLVNNNRKQLNTDFSDGILFQLVLIYRLSLTK